MIAASFRLLQALRAPVAASFHLLPVAASFRLLQAL